MKYDIICRASHIHIARDSEFENSNFAMSPESTVNLSFLTQNCIKEIIKNKKEEKMTKKMQMQTLVSEQERSREEELTPDIS